VRTLECDLARQRVSLELDGELPSREVAPLYRHLACCPACAAFAADARRCSELLRTTPLEAPPPFALRGRRVARRASTLAAAVASVAAAALVAVSTLSVSISPYPDVRPVPFGFSPQGLPVIPGSDQTLGVQRPAVGPRSAGDPRRGAAAVTLA
jgi:predicted anti-sigma-YlaC factor YlaD